MKPPKQKTTTAFGLFKSAKSLVVNPENLEDLEQCLDFAKQRNFKVSIQGGGNSYGDVFFNNQLVIDTKYLNSIKLFDQENGIITVEPGLRMGDLLRVVMPQNWILVGLSGSVNDSVGGMLATNTHGKDTWKNGNFSQNIISFKIIFANGTTKEIQKDKDSELFNSIVGGLGFLGLITEVTLKLKPIPSYMVEQSTQRISNFEALDGFFYSLEERGFEYAYTEVNPFISGKNIGQGIAYSCRLIDQQNCSNEKFNEFLVKKTSVYMLKPKNYWSLCRFFWSDNAYRLLCFVKYLAAPILNSNNVVPLPKFQYPHSAKPNFNSFFIPSGFFDFQTIFPRDTARQAIKEFLLIGQHYKIYPSLCSIKRHKSDSSYLSFANDGLSIAWTFSLNGITPKKRDEYCEKLTDIALAYNGRTYLAKHPYFAKDDFHSMYPDYKRVLEMKKKHDPDCLFLSQATQRLLHV